MSKNNVYNIRNDKMKKIAGILLTASFVFVAGICVAYYNTSSIGYDNANIISFNNEEVNIFDYRIEYKNVEDKFEKIKKVLPDEYITI